jgi:hypothetical protein
VVGHAIAFPTWQSLVRQQGLDDARCVEMMLTWLRCLARVDCGAGPDHGRQGAKSS